MTSRSGAERVQRRRDKLRAAGLRPIQIWVPDTRARFVADECARQARLARESEGVEDEDGEFWSGASDMRGWSA